MHVKPKKNQVETPISLSLLIPDEPGFLNNVNNNYNRNNNHNYDISA